MFSFGSWKMFITDIVDSINPITTTTIYTLHHHIFVFVSWKQNEKRMNFLLYIDIISRLLLLFTQQNWTNVICFVVVVDDIFFFCSTISGFEFCFQLISVFESQQTTTTRIVEKVFSILFSICLASIGNFFCFCFFFN